MSMKPSHRHANQASEATETAERSASNQGVSPSADPQVGSGATLEGIKDTTFEGMKGTTASANGNQSGTPGGNAHSLGSNGTAAGTNGSAHPESAALLGAGSRRRTLKAVLLGTLLLILAISGRHLLPYLSGLLGACTVYVLLRGQMRFLVEKKHWNAGWAATLLIVEVIFLFLIPLTLVVFMLVDILQTLPDNIAAWYEQIQALFADGGWVSQMEARFQISIRDNISFENLKDLTKVGSSLVQRLGAETYAIGLNTFVLLFVLFFMLRGYRSFEQAIVELLPFDEKNKRIVLRESVALVRSNAIGIPLLALIQGAFAYIGYLMLGIDNALLYAVLTAITTVVPVVGTMLVWIPLSVSFLFAGNWVNAVILASYGFIIIGGVDNIVRFLLQKQLADTHPLITIFGVIIGLSIFGFWGIIFGPLLFSLFFLLINIYRREFIPGSKATLSLSSQSQEEKKKKAPLIHRAAQKAQERLRRK